MVWRFFLPEYQLCCFLLGRWIGCSVQSMIKASASWRLTRIVRLTPELAQPVQRPTDARLVGLIRASHETLRDSASVQNQKDKEVILNSTYTPRTTEAVLWCHDPLLPIGSNVSQSMPLNVRNCYLEISRALLNFAIGRTSIALPFLNYTRMNKVSPDFCNKSSQIRKRSF